MYKFNTVDILHCLLPWRPPVLNANPCVKWFILLHWELSNELEAPTHFQSSLLISVFINFKEQAPSVAKSYWLSEFLSFSSTEVSSVVSSLNAMCYSLLDSKYCFDRRCIFLVLLRYAGHSFSFLFRHIAWTNLCYWPCIHQWKEQNDLEWQVDSLIIHIRMDWQ